MGPVERKIRQSLSKGMILTTVPDKAPFKVGDLLNDALVLLYGKQGTRTRISWECLEGIPAFLAGRGWVEIRAVHDTVGIPGTLDSYIKSRCVKRTSGGYVASVLESSRIVTANYKKPAKVRLRDDWAQ